MIAKAGYAVHRGLVDPEQILMLAFNSKAAAELQQRIRERLAPLGLAADKIVARTFHSFGLSVIGQATGRKPSLAPWLDQGADVISMSLGFDFPGSVKRMERAGLPTEAAV